MVLPANDPSVSFADSSLYAREPRGLGASCFGLEVSGPCRNSFPALRSCASPTNMGSEICAKRQFSLKWVFMLEIPIIMRYNVLQSP